MRDKVTKKLGDIAEFINGGAWSQTEYADSGIPVVRVSDIHDCAVSLSGCKYLPQSVCAKYAKHELREGDLVICTIGSHPTQPNSVVGRPGIMSKSCEGAFLNQNAVCIRPLDKSLDKRWLGYFARSQVMKDYIIAHARGSANQVRVAISALKDMDVFLPPIEEQKKVSDVLSDYDGLIENNARRIKILEEMARAIYREWFVKFRFPGHGKIKMTGSPLGKIPKGWEVKALGDITANFDRLRKPLSKMQRAERQGVYPYYGAARIFDYIDDYIFDGIYLLMAEDGSVITPDRKPVLQYVTGKFWANNHTHILQGTGDVSMEFLYLVLSDMDVTGYITGAAQPKITQANLNRIPVVVSDDSTLQSFNEIISGMFRQKVSLDEKNKVLRQTRDLLLPRLISGELDVSELDIEAAQEVA